MEGPASSLNHISQHDEGCFLGPWPWAVVPIFVLANALMTFFSSFKRLVIKELYQACPVMLLDNFDNGSTKSIISSLFDTLLHVRDNYQGAHAGL